jgi:hypothetical protein
VKLTARGRLADETQIVTVLIEVRIVGLRSADDRHARVFEEGMDNVRRDEVMPGYGELVLSRETLPSCRRTEICRVEERDGARLEDPIDFLQVLPQEMQVEVHEDIEYV